MRTALFSLLMAATVTAPWVPAAPHDSTWPPEKDPTNAAENHPPGDPVHIGSIAFDFPPEYEEWFDTTHGSNYFGTFAFGDVLGEDDGEQHIVIAMPGEAVMAAKYSIHFPSQTGTLEPIWFWLSPYAQDPDYDAASPSRWKSFNILLDDFDDDGKNEVVVNSAEKDFIEVLPSGQEVVRLKQVLFVLQTDEADPAPVSPYLDPSTGQPYSHPAPVEMARSASDPAPNEVGERLGICKVSDEGLDIALHEHAPGDFLSVWKYTNPSGDQGHHIGQIDVRYKMEIFNPINTLNATGVKTHESNYVDVDGDGFDEFFMNGLIDFVDADPVTGAAVPTHPNPAKAAFGVARWQIYGVGGTKGHFDQLLCADWDRDPTDPTPLELLGLTESGGGPHPYPLVVDVFLEPDTGNTINVNLNAPAQDPQTALGGNFTRTRQGLEAVFVPKDFDNDIRPPGQVDFCASYVIDAQQNTLAIDGVNFGNINTNIDYPSQPVIGRMATGPATPRLMAVDWDGERSQDEVMATPWRTINIWSLQDKVDIAIPYPAGFPLETDLKKMNGDIKPFTIDGNDYTVWYYQGNLNEPHPEWAWNNNGPGRFSHYWVKLGEIHPFAGQYEAIPYDVGGDHREEIVVMNPQGLFFLYNPNPLSVDPVVSPSVIPAYRRHRMEENIFPFAFEDLPELTGVQIRPADDTLPSTCVGMRLRKKMQLQAVARFSDGTEVDVTKRVNWIDDPETNAHISFSSDPDEVGVVVSKLERTSARLQAELPYGSTGESMKSNFLYVLASDRDQPEVLMAGYGETYLDQGNTNPLRVSALVAQRDNETNLLVPVLKPDNTYWRPFGQDVYLHDDGLNGDPFAGDGVWSAEINPGPQDGNQLSLGDNLLVVKAAWLENVIFMSPIFFNGGPDFHVSEAWPYKTFGLQGVLPTPAPPAAIDEAVAFWAPRVLVSGMRGHGADPDELLIEAVIGEFSLDATAPVSVEAYLSWRDEYVTLTPRGLGVYSKLIDASDAPNGSYVIPVQATATYSFAGYTEWASDFASYLYLHNAIP